MKLFKMLAGDVADPFTYRRDPEAGGEWHIVVAGEPETLCGKTGWENWVRRGLAERPGDAPFCPTCDTGRGWRKTNKGSARRGGRA